MESFRFELTDGELKISITVTETLDGSLQFDVNVLDDTGYIGDLNGLFFDLADDSILDNLAVSGDDLTGEAMKVDGVTKVDGYNNVNGEVANESGKFDIGVQFGTQGIGEDDIQSTSFTLSTTDGSALSIDDVLMQDFAVRLTSTGEVDGDRDGSVKIGGIADPVDPPVDPEPTNEAINDSMTVSNLETFSPFGIPDDLDFFQRTLLENDTTSDGTTYSGTITHINGQEFVEGAIYEGLNGGQLIVNWDGTVDFNANNDFDYLVDDETAMTQFNYTIEGGSTATLDVNVFAFDDTGGPGGGGDDFPVGDDFIL